MISQLKDCACHPSAVSSQLATSVSAYRTMRVPDRSSANECLRPTRLNCPADCHGAQKHLCGKPQRYGGGGSVGRHPGACLHSWCVPMTTDGAGGGGLGGLCQLQPSFSVPSQCVCNPPAGAFVDAADVAFAVSRALAKVSLDSASCQILSEVRGARPLPLTVSLARQSLSF